MAKIDINTNHRKLADLSRPVENIPTGVWQLRAISIKAKEITRTNRDGEEFETVEYTTVLEPVKPTASVNPAEVAAVDERTGKPVYDGKRLFIRSTEAFNNNMKSLAAMLGAMGFTGEDDFDEIVENNRVKGKMVYGEVYNRTYPRKDGTDGVEQLVKSWSSAAAADSLAI